MLEETLSEFEKKEIFRAFATQNPRRAKPLQRNVYESAAVFVQRISRKMCEPDDDMCETYFGMC
jgi:predicted AAA+ superfamily ATPase